MDEGVHFRVWAPKRRRVEVVIEGGPASPATIELTSTPDGYFEGLAPGAADGTLYRYKLDGSDGPFPDPASRFQPSGPHGPSRVVDPSRFAWSDRAFRAAALKEHVIYELHIGTFTREGTLAAAANELEALAEMGISMIELMPVADFPGRFGWGYDGVNLFAPTRLYGEPDDLRRFVDKAHAAGLAVILDVVYNHLGPDGNYLAQYSDAYFTDRYGNEWGAAINFDGDHSGPVRELFTSNAGYWIDEFHMDGLRLDATHSIHDKSRDHILAAIDRRARAAAQGGTRPILLIAENDDQEAKLVRPKSKGGYGLDGVWNDDYHHSAVVAMTGRAEAYYTEYRGSPQELISAMKWGYLYQGQRFAWQKKQRRRGSPAFDIELPSFITFIENHDQVSASARGLRCHQMTSPGRYRAMTALTLLGPGTPMLFQGQEFASTSPFFFFADHEPPLAALVRKGRAEFLARFPSYASEEAQRLLPDPAAIETFERCKLDLSERARHKEAVALHTDLLALRREDPTLRRRGDGGIEGAVLGPEAFVLRYFGRDGDDRLLFINLGADLHEQPAPEPLLAPPEGARFRVLWSSEDPRYGGSGTPPIETESEGLRLPGQAAILLSPSFSEV